MSAHADLYARTAAVSLNAQHGEPATLVPAGVVDEDGQVAVTVRVDRGIREDREDGKTRIRSVTVRLSVADLPAPKEGGDRLRLPPWPGDDPRTYTLERVEDQVGGEWILRFT